MDVCPYLGSEVSRDPQRELGSCRMLPEVQQSRRLSVVQRGRLAVVRHRRVAVVYGGLPVVGERRVTEIRFHVLPGFDLRPMGVETTRKKPRCVLHKS